MRNTQGLAASPPPPVKVRLKSGPSDDYLAEIVRDLSARPEEAARASLWQMLDQSGYVCLHAMLDGRRCTVSWDPVAGQVQQKSDPAIPEHFVSWCRRVHMNLVMSYCRLGTFAQEPSTEQRVFTAATGNAYQRPSDAIDWDLELLGEACRWEGIHGLWATGLVADRNDDENTHQVEFIYETKQGTPNIRTEVLRAYLSRLLSYDISLTWREQSTDGAKAHVTIKKTRQLWKNEE